MTMFRIIHPNRWFFWTISILIIAGLGLLLYINQAVQELEEQSFQLTKPTLGWKIFHSETLGLSVKYPPSWQVEVDRLEPNAVNLENPRNFSENISISVVKPSLEKIIRSSLKIASEEDITIDSTKGTWIKGSDRKDQATQNVVLVKKDSRLYYIAGTAAAFEKIVAGIKFIN